MSIPLKLMFISLLSFALLALPTHAADTAVGKDDQGFVTEAASAGRMEVELGELAMKSAKTQEVKDFANTMIRDHGKANGELEQIAKKKNLQLPLSMLPEHLAKIEKLQELKAEGFDKEYMREMVEDHGKDVEKFREAQQWLRDPELKAWAGKTLPVLEQHLQRANTVAQKVGADVKKNK